MAAVFRRSESLHPCVCWHKPWWNLLFNPNSDFGKQRRTAQMQFAEVDSARRLAVHRRHYDLKLRDAPRKIIALFRSSGLVQSVISG